MTGLMVGSAVAYAAYSFTAPGSGTRFATLNIHTPANATGYWMSTYNKTHTHKHTYIYTHAAIYTHRIPARSSARLMDWSQTRDFPAAEDEKTSVQNCLKVNVYPLADRFSFVQIMLRFGSVDKESGKKNKTWDLVVEEIMWNSENVADLAHSPAWWSIDLSNVLSSTVMNFSQELCICQQADGSALSVSQWNYCQHVCECANSWHLYIGKVKWFFAVAAGSERLAVFNETLCRVLHMLHFMSSQICRCSKSRDDVREGFPGPC